MKRKELERLLSHVAEWVYPKIRYDGREKLDPDNIIGVNNSHDYYSPRKEDSGPRIIEIKQDLSLKPCEWCGKVVNQRCSYQKIWNRVTKLWAWQYECQTCRRIYDPETKKLATRASLAKKK